MGIKARTVRKGAWKSYGGAVLQEKEFEVRCACGRIVRFDATIAARCHCGRLYWAEPRVRLDDGDLLPGDEAAALDGQYGVEWVSEAKRGT